MAYGGAPKAVDVSQFDYVRDWVGFLTIILLHVSVFLYFFKSVCFQQNTYQLVIASDRIVSYVMFNYARLNWTTSNEAGGLNGFGGKQAAVVTIISFSKMVQ